MAEVWLIVDAAERPDLVDRIHAETIHSPRCAYCGVRQALDEPLLFHDGRAQTLIFAAPEAGTDEQKQNLARQLGQQLIASLPLAERQPYLATAQLVAGIAELHVALDGGAEQTSDELSLALTALMAAESPAQARAAAEAHPILRTDDAIAQLRAYVEQLRAGQHVELAAALAERIAALSAELPTLDATPQPHPARTLLQALLDADSPEQRQALLRSQAQTITPELTTMLAALAEQAQRQQLDAVARDLLVIRDEVAATLNQERSIPPAPEGA
jgi:hypothetical protein